MLEASFCATSIACRRQSSGQPIQGLAIHQSIFSAKRNESTSQLHLKKLASTPKSATFLAMQVFQKQSHDWP